MARSPAAGVSPRSTWKPSAPPPATVQLRFDIGRDGCGGIDGWYVDNVTISTCEEAAGHHAVEAKAHAPRKVRFRSDFLVHVKVSTKSHHHRATGIVEIREDGHKIAQGRLSRGHAVIRVRKNLRIGQHRLVAAYLGNDATRPARTRSESPSADS